MGALHPNPHNPSCYNTPGLAPGHCAGMQEERTLIQLLTVWYRLIQLLRR